MEFDNPKKYPTLNEVLDILTKLSKKELEELSDYRNVPMLTRVQLIQFLNEWVNDDLGLSSYIGNIPKGYPVDKALMMGDLLVFMMLGGDIKEYNRKQPTRLADPDGTPMPQENRWNSFLGKMIKKMPETKSLKDMVGVHAMVLNMLPQTNYNRYNFTQIFADDPSLVDQVLGEKISMTPADFETLNNLRSIVRRGAIEQLKLALSTSTAGLKQMSGSGDMGSRLLEAFQIAQRAVSFFERGEFGKAVENLQELQDEYDLGTGAFTNNINNVFLGTVSAISDSNSIKGSPAPVLLSLDTRHKPDGIMNMSDAAKAIQRTASRQCFAYDWNNNNKKLSVFNVDSPKKSVSGTSGVKTFMGHTGGYSNRKQDQSKMHTTTDWYALMSAAFYGGNNTYSDGVLTPQNLQTGADAAFKDNDRPVLKFLVHGVMSNGIQNLLPIGLLSVSVNKPTQTIGIKDGNSFPMPDADVDLIYESYSDLDKEIEKNIATIDSETDDETGTGNLLEDMDMFDGARRRKASKKPSKKKVSTGQMIGVDLLPVSQVRLSTAVDKADWYKNKAKQDETGLLKQLWNNYARGYPIKKQRRGRKPVWVWRGKEYSTEKEAVAALKTKGTWADMKKGTANMRMIYAKRKDNNELVPFRLVIPKIILRKRGNDLLAKKGGSKESVELLLKEIENDFGKIVYKRKQPGGGYARYPTQRTKGDKNIKPITTVDHGLHHLYETKGFEAGSGYSTNAHPSRIRNDGKIIYQAMTPTGTSVEMEVSS